MNEWSAFLDTIGWDYFCTFTTRKPISIRSARRIAERISERIDAGTSSDMFWAAEPFDVREGFHLHALINTGIRAMDIWDWYYPRYGRCQIITNTSPHMRLAASEYMTKYATKVQADFDLYLSKAHRQKQRDFHVRMDQKRQINISLR